MNPSEPVRTATGATVVVTAILTAFFLVARDLGLVVAADTQAAITGAIIVVATIVANEWARNRVTPTP